VWAVTQISVSFVALNTILGRLSIPIVSEVTMLKWTDTTSYSRGDTERVPTTWCIGENRIKISVTKGHIYYPDKWVMHCFTLKIDTLPLKAETLEDAQSEALETVRRSIENLDKEFKGLFT
jgi:hypothetical protein